MHLRCRGGFRSGCRSIRRPNAAGAQAVMVEDAVDVEGRHRAFNCQPLASDTGDSRAEKVTAWTSACKVWHQVNEAWWVRGTAQHGPVAA